MFLEELPDGDFKSFKEWMRNEVKTKNTDNWTTEDSQIFMQYLEERKKDPAFRSKYEAWGSSPQVTIGTPEQDAASRNRLQEQENIEKAKKRLAAIQQRRKELLGQTGKSTKAKDPEEKQTEKPKVRITLDSKDENNKAALAELRKRRIPEI